jgi:hypothetical protein
LVALDTENCIADVVIATARDANTKKFLFFPSQSSTMATILFDSSKNELFKLNDNFKTVNRKLKANYKTET